MNTQKITLLFIAAVSVTALVLSFLGLKGDDNIVYFDYNQVYNNSDIKNRLEKDLKKVGSMRQSELDSLQMELSFLSKKIGENSTSEQELGNFEDLKERYLGLQQHYEEESVRLKETYFNQIREEINQKAKTFAETKGYDYVFAGMGDGTLMYGSEALDVTDEFQKYLNQ